MLKMPPHFTLRIILALFIGALFGVILKVTPINETLRVILVDDVLNTGGRLFISLLKMLVVPVVFVSLVCGVSSLGSVKMLGRIGLKTFVLYVFTTVIALTIGLFVASFLNVGSSAELHATSNFVSVAPPSLKDVVIGLVPSNPVEAMASGNMLQLIFFSLVLGMSMTMSGKHGSAIRKLFLNFNEVLMKLVFIVMVLAPYGIFFLLASLFARQGLSVLLELLQYLLVVVLVLFIHLFVSYGLMLHFFAKLNPLRFFKKMYDAMLFAFGVSSSNASIPIVMETAEKKLGVQNSVASFVIPLGASINMDGTAIMQSVATVFIANVYHIDIGLSGYLTVVFMATLASIGTAGVPGVGLITLTMVLQQVGLPAEGIALIIGVDRIIDMLRTAVNICGDSVISCLVAKSENLFDTDIYESK
ncbi:MAG: dicarboxylate/amino acid:cation symporter [Legionellaceae bacterium]|nr:dicarboxylate/amino acid:cation symporter [Legionellaceae bacterium]